MSDSKIFYEIGDPCPECSTALELDTENCYCHIRPPCGNCEAVSLRCPECDFETGAQMESPVFDTSDEFIEWHAY